MSATGPFDVLVIGSGASGLAAAVSAERAGARVALATKGSIQSCNSAKAQGGIQAAFGEDDSPEQHAQDVWALGHETRGHAARRGADAEAPVGDPLARGARRRVHARERRLPPRPLRRRLARSGCSRSATARATRSRRRCARRVEAGSRHARSRTAPLHELEPTANGWRARCGEHAIDAGDRRPRRRRALLRRGGGARRALDEPSRRDRRGDADRARRSAPRRATSTRSSTTRTAARGRETMQGYSIPETTRAYGAVLLNADGEEFTDSLGPRDVVAQAIVDEVAKGKGVETPDGRPAVYLDTTRIAAARRRALAPVHAAPLPRRRASTRSRRRSSPTPSSTTRTAAS